MRWTVLEDHWELGPRIHVPDLVDENLQEERKLAIGPIPTKIDVFADWCVKDKLPVLTLRTFDIS